MKHYSPTNSTAATAISTLVKLFSENTQENTLKSFFNFTENDLSKLNSHLFQLFSELENRHTYQYINKDTEIVEIIEYTYKKLLLSIIDEIGYKKSLPILAVAQGALYDLGFYLLHNSYRIEVWKRIQEEGINDQIFIDNIDINQSDITDPYTTEYMYAIISENDFKFIKISKPDLTPEKSLQNTNKTYISYNDEGKKIIFHMPNDTKKEYIVTGSTQRKYLKDLFQDDKNLAINTSDEDNGKAIEDCFRNLNKAIKLKIEIENVFDIRVGKVLLSNKIDIIPED